MIYCGDHPPPHIRACLGRPRSRGFAEARCCRLVGLESRICDPISLGRRGCRCLESSVRRTDVLRALPAFALARAQLQTAGLSWLRTHLSARRGGEAAGEPSRVGWQGVPGHADGARRGRVAVGSEQVSAGGASVLGWSRLSGALGGRSRLERDRDEALGGAVEGCARADEAEAWLQRQGRRSELRLERRRPAACVRGCC